MTEKRYVRRQGLTREEIGKIPHGELANHPDLSVEEKRLAKVLARAQWDSRPMKRRPDESAGEFNKRKREAGQTDKSEYSRVQRKAFEKALYDSESQKLKRLMDTQTGGITKEIAQAGEKLQAELEQKSRQESFQDGGFSRPGVARWEK